MPRPCSEPVQQNRRENKVGAEVNNGAIGASELEQGREGGVGKVNEDGPPDGYERQGERHAGEQSEFEDLYITTGNDTCGGYRRSTADEDKDEAGHGR